MKNKKNRYPSTERTRLEKWKDMIKQYEGKDTHNPTTFTEDLQIFKKKRQPAYYSEEAITTYDIEDVTNRPTINNIEYRKQEENRQMDNLENEIITGLFAQKQYEEPNINHTTTKKEKNNITEDNFRQNTTKGTFKEVKENIFTTPDYVQTEDKAENNNFLPNIMGTTHIEEIENGTTTYMLIDTKTTHNLISTEYILKNKTTFKKMKVNKYKMEKTPIRKEKPITMGSTEIKLTFTDTSDKQITIEEQFYITSEMNGIDIILGQPIWKSTEKVIAKTQSIVHIKDTNNPQSVLECRANRSIGSDSGRTVSSSSVSTTECRIHGHR